MEAKLNIYADCTSEKPTKTYVCRRLLLKVSKKVASLVEGMNGKSEADTASLQKKERVFLTEIWVSSVKSIYLPRPLRWNLMKDELLLTVSARLTNWNWPMLLPFTNPREVNIPLW